MYCLYERKTNKWKKSGIRPPNLKKKKKILLCRTLFWYLEKCFLTGSACRVMKKSGRRRFLGPGERFFNLLDCFEILRVTFTTTSYNFLQNVLVSWKWELRKKAIFTECNGAVSESPLFNLLAPIYFMYTLSSSFKNLNIGGTSRFVSDIGFTSFLFTSYPSFLLPFPNTVLIFPPANWGSFHCKLLLF